MGADPRKRQKKLERRTAKRKEKRHDMVRQSNVGLGERLTAATRFPVLHCWIGTSLEDQGIGWVLLSREVPGGRVAIATFLVDRYCLGVKDVWAEVLDRSAYDEKYVRKVKTDMPSRNAPPAEACKLLRDAVAYANSIGLKPHGDYSKAALLFGDVDPADSNEVFEFGKDGMPLFISGPNDTPERCRQIVAILNNTCGAGHFHYILSVAPPEFDGLLPPVSKRGPVSLLEGVGEEDFDEEEAPRGAE